MSGTPTRPFADTDRIGSVTLDPLTITSINPDEVHEWRIAIYDLVEDNHLRPARVEATGPFALHISIVGNWIVLDVRDPQTYRPISAHYLSLTPFRRLIRDYFRIRDRYYEAIRAAQPYRIETVDMARRGLHDEAANLLRERLAGKLEMDHETARRLFTLICAVQPYASRIDARSGALPTVLFVCSMNSVRSPIAAALARRRFPGRLLARSVGVNGGKADQFVHAVMDEIGIDMSVHTPHTMDELGATHFDLVVTLSEDAPEAVARKGLVAEAIEHWPVNDPTLVEGRREEVLGAYRALREDLGSKIEARLAPLATAPQAGGSQGT